MHTSNEEKFPFTHKLVFSVNITSQGLFSAVPNKQHF